MKRTYAKRLKILIFVEEFLPSTETFVYNQLKWLAGNHHIYIICLTRTNKHLFPWNGLQVIPVDPSFKEKWRSFLQSKLIFPDFKIPALSRYLKLVYPRFSPNIILTHFGLNALFLEHALPFDHVPLIFFFHGYDASQLMSQSASYRKHMKILLANPRCQALFVTQSMNDHISSKFSLARPGRVINMGVNTGYFKRTQYTSHSNTRSIIQVGAFVEKKGQDLAIRAFADWRGPHTLLNFVGDGPNINYCRSLCRQLGVESNIKFWGYQEPSRIKQLLENACAFIHPSRTSKSGDQEGIPVSIMEAMSMELPVLSTLHSGIPELVDDKINGYLVAEGDVRQLSESIGKTIELGLLPENRLKIKRHFNLSIQNEKLEALLWELSEHNDKI